MMPLSTLSSLPSIALPLPPVKPYSTRIAKCYNLAHMLQPDQGYRDMRPLSPKRLAASRWAAPRGTMQHTCCRAAPRTSSSPPTSACWRAFTRPPRALRRRSSQVPCLLLACESFCKIYLHIPASDAACDVPCAKEHSAPS